MTATTVSRAFAKVFNIDAKTWSCIQIEEGSLFPYAYTVV